MVQVTMKIQLAVLFTLLGYRNSDIIRYLALLSNCVYNALKFTLSCFQVQLWIEMPERVLVRSLSAKYRPDRYRHDKSVKFGTELP